ncbi:hypothetical protein TNCV_1709021 [Trichonephila clavipes]|nr:hypothetical protein TNCV_1709021 [Trichonephila clavipes]
MASDPIFCHLIQEYFPYSYDEASGSSLAFNQEFTPKGPLIKDLIDLVVRAFKVIEIVLQEIWSKHIVKIRRSMIQSAEFYVWHTMCMCWMEEQFVTDIYDRFLSTIVLDTHEWMVYTGDQNRDRAGFKASVHDENEGVNELLRHWCPFILQRQSKLSNRYWW